MSEYIEREAIRNELYEADAITMKGIEILNNFPAADVVEVVRCKGCKHWENGKDYEPYCNHFGNMMSDTKADDYCSYGERKTQEDQ